MNRYRLIAEGNTSRHIFPKFYKDQVWKSKQDNSNIRLLEEYNDERGPGWKILWDDRRTGTVLTNREIESWYEPL